MIQDKSYYQLIPEKVESEKDAICGLIAPIIKGFSVDYLNEVISVIAIHHRGEPTPLKMTYIKKLVPQGDKYLNALIDLGIVERSGNFKPGQVSYKYEFSDTYYSRFVSIPLKNPKLIRRIESVQKEFQKTGAKTTRGRSEQIPNLKKLTIDPGYKLYIEQFKDDIDKYNSIKASATLIENGQIFYSVDSTSGRFHSNATNIKSELRAFLRIDGEPLGNIDVVNCQPLLSTIILTDPSKVSWMTVNPDFALLLQTLKVSHKEDVKKYISLVISGEIYEYLMAEFSKEGLYLTRKETKIQVLRILFARNRMPRKPINDKEIYIEKLTDKQKKAREVYIIEFPKIKKAREIFIKCFPSVHRIFSKVRGSGKGDRTENFKRFAILLQKIESYLMLEVILKRVYRELPGVIAITIHDSIMTGLLTNQVEAVKKIMEEELTEFVGCKPEIKIEIKLSSDIINNLRKEKNLRVSILSN